MRPVSTPNGPAPLRLAAPSCNPASATESPPAIALVQLQVGTDAVEAIVRHAVEQALAATVTEREQLAGLVAELRTAIAAGQGGAANAEAARPAAPAGFMSRQDFAAAMGLSVSTFDRMESMGRVGPMAVRPNGAKGRKLFDRREVDEWLAAPRDGHGQLPDRKEWTARRAARK